MARIYTNENFPIQIASILCSMGHDVLTTRQAGRSNQRIPDEQVLSYAIQDRRILITYNRSDFIKLHRKNQNHAGIIVCAVDTDRLRLANRIDAELQSHKTFEGLLIKITTWDVQIL